MYERNVEIPILNTCRRRSDLVLKHICVNKNFFCCRKKKKGEKNTEILSLDFSIPSVFFQVTWLPYSLLRHAHTHTQKKEKKIKYRISHMCNLTLWKLH